MVFTLVACDVPHGFQTQATFTQKPNVDCISEALGQLGPVERHKQPGNGMTTLDGQPILEIDWWIYRGSLRLDVYRTPKGWQYNNGNVGLASPNDMDRLRDDVPDIRVANQLLERICGVPLGKFPVNAL